jgi:NhaP-type Na+/H+ or K+/H+ antiporter
VLLRGFLRRRDIPPATRQALRLESGLNDVVLLPVVVIAMELMEGGTAHGETEWGRVLVSLLILGPAVGIAVGLLGVWTLDRVRRHVGVRRDYEALYSLGVAFAAFAGAEALHASGFLAAFAAGLTIAALDVELCDCFLEYGDTTAEMALLLTFVLFGSSLIWSGLAMVTFASLAFAVLVLLARPLTFIVALAGSRLQKRDKVLISWFGPRGLSSLLLALLPVFAGLEQSELIFAYCCLVVLISVAVHGGSLMFVSRDPATDRQVERAVGEDTVRADGPAPPAAAEALSLLPLRAQQDGAYRSGPPGTPEMISIDQFRQLLAQGEPVLVLDVRTDRTFDADNLMAEGAVRVHPDDAVRDAARLKLPRDVLMVAYCA